MTFTEWCEKKNKHKLSCCILAHDDIQLTLGLLSSIVGQDVSESNKLIFKLIVDSNQKEMLEKTPQFKRIARKLNLNLLLAASKDVSSKRNMLLRSCTTSSLLMLDGDTELPRKTYLKTVLDLLDANTDNQVWTGPYKNSNNCSLWGLSYNFVANCWLKKSIGFPELSHFLGGVFLMAYFSKEQIEYFSFEENQFGGEEIKFSNSLRAQGIPIKWNEEIGVVHHCRHNLRTFWRRALAHGTAVKTARTSFRANLEIFFKTPAPFLVKTMAFFYVFLTKATHVLRSRPGMRRF